MILLEQQGGTIDLQPVFYGGECAGPIIQLIEVHKDPAGKVVVDAVKGRFKLRLKEDGKLDLRKGQV